MQAACTKPLKMRDTLQSVASPDFQAAAHRHHGDAAFLLANSRWANADHLAGLAAECALKAIMQLMPFGATPNAQGILVWGPSSKKLKQHVDKLWSELALNLSGYTAPTFIGLLTGPGPGPFANWRVEDRYSDGLTVTQQEANDHLGATRQVLIVLQQAMIDGYVS
jgi:hypothetical protein